MISTAEKIETLANACIRHKFSDGVFGKGYRDADGFIHISLADGSKWKAWTDSRFWNVQRQGTSVCGAARTVLEAARLCHEAVTR